MRRLILTHIVHLLVFEISVWYRVKTKYYGNFADINFVFCFIFGTLRVKKHPIIQISGTGDAVGDLQQDDHRLQG